MEHCFIEVFGKEIKSLKPEDGILDKLKIELIVHKLYPDGGIEQNDQGAKDIKKLQIHFEFRTYMHLITNEINYMLN